MVADALDATFAITRCLVSPRMTSHEVYIVEMTTEFDQITTACNHGVRAVRPIEWLYSGRCR
jgi:hypothetical protein